MFVKKDTRKVTEILYDEKGTRDNLKLGRREAEFGGGTKLLLDPTHAERLADVQVLSLYDNKLKELNYISTLAHYAHKLEELNVSGHGRGGWGVGWRGVGKSCSATEVQAGFRAALTRRGGGPTGSTGTIPVEASCCRVGGMYMLEHQLSLLPLSSLSFIDHLSTTLLCFAPLPSPLPPPPCSLAATT